MSSSSFFSLEVAENSLDSCRLGFLTVKSRQFHSRGDITVYLPPNAEKSGPIPVITLLHGIYGSHWAWTIKGRAHETMEKMIRSGESKPMAILMPSDGLWGDGSGYVAHHSSDFENWIVKDVPRAAKEAWPNIEFGPVQFIAGLSMGGFGALSLGIKHPSIYSAISGHSSVTDLDQLDSRVEKPFISEDASGKLNLIDIIQDSSGPLPKIRFDCGIDDELIEANRNLHSAMKSLSIPHHFEEFEGAHTWDYWEEHFVDTIQFFNQYLSTKDA